MEYFVKREYPKSKVHAKRAKIWRKIRKVKVRKLNTLRSLRFVCELCVNYKLLYFWVSPYYYG